MWSTHCRHGLCRCIGSLLRSKLHHFWRYGSFPAYAGFPHTNEHLCDHVFITILLTSALLSPRPGWNRRWCYHRQALKPLCDSHHSVGNTITVQSDINPRATVASIKVLFRGIKASIHTRFALSHAHGLGILLYHECCIAHIQGNPPTFWLNATVRAAFMPDSTLEFLPIFSSLKCTKTLIFSHFLHSLQWFDPQKSPRCFQA